LERPVVARSGNEAAWAFHESMRFVVPIEAKYRKSVRAPHGHRR
jgi:hypothetical protein